MAMLTLSVLYVCQYACNEHQKTCHHMCNSFGLLIIGEQLNRTAELARVFGIDFYSVFSRGSQYRVESMMLRLAHTQNFLLISPSRQQVCAHLVPNVNFPILHNLLSKTSRFEGHRM